MGQQGAVTECCDACKFFLRYAGADEWGGCRRNPPDWDNRLGMSQYRPVHPETPACGEFRFQPQGVFASAEAVPVPQPAAEAASDLKVPIKMVS